MNTTELTLEILKKCPNGISGETIAEELGLSRNAVWKAIGELRANGFTVEASSGRGYLLKGEKYITVPLLEKYLNMKHPLYTYRSASSTNDLAKAGAEAGAEEGSVFIADSQTSGRGRTGKSFYSPDGTGIYMTIVLRPKMAATEALKITTCAAVAVADAIFEVTGKRLGIKWVNDLFCDNKKVCGILTEASFNMETGGLNYALLGIGIDVFAPKDGFGELSDIAGALYPYSDNTAELRCRIAGAVCNKFFEYYNDMEAGELFEKYRSRLFILGKKITVIKGAEKHAATVLGLEKDYKLIVRYQNGEVESLSSGEISIIPD